MFEIFKDKMSLCFLKGRAPTWTSFSWQPGKVPRKLVWFSAQGKGASSVEWLLLKRCLSTSLVQLALPDSQGSEQGSVCQVHCGLPWVGGCNDQVALAGKLPRAGTSLPCQPHFLGLGQGAAQVRGSKHTHGTHQELGEPMKNQKSSDSFWGRGTIRIPKGSHLPKCQARGAAGEGVTWRGCQSRVGVVLSAQPHPPMPVLAVSKGWCGGQWWWRWHGAHAREGTRGGGKARRQWLLWIPPTPGRTWGSPGLSGGLQPRTPMDRVLGSLQPGQQVGERAPCRLASQQPMSGSEKAGLPHHHGVTSPHR